MFQLKPQVKKTVKVTGGPLTITVIPIVVQPNQVRETDGQYLVGDSKLLGTDNVLRKATPGIRLQFQWPKGKAGFGSKSPIFVHTPAQFGEHTQQDDANLFVFVSDNGKDILVNVQGGDAAASFSWWGVYTSLGFQSSFMEGPI